MQVQPSVVLSGAIEGLGYGREFGAPSVDEFGQGQQRQGQRHRKRAELKSAVLVLADKTLACEQVVPQLT